MSCCPTNNNESISILNRTREAAVCAQTNCASAEESAEAAAISAYAASVSAGQAAASAALGVIIQGIGSPEGVVVGTVGTLYTDKNGAAGTTLYVKESGSGNTGWSAK